MKKLVFVMVLLLLPMTVVAQHRHHRPTINIENRLDSNINLNVNDGIFTIMAHSSMDIWNHNRHIHSFDIRFHDWSGREWYYTQYNGWQGMLQDTTDGDFNLFSK